MRRFAFLLPLLARLAPLCLALLVLSGPVLAQQDQAADTQAQDGGSPAVITVRELEALIATLENDASRKTFLDDLKALVAAQEQMAGGDVADSSPTLLGRIAEKLANINAQFEDLFSELDYGAGLISWFRVQIETPLLRNSWIKAVWQATTTIVLAAALAYLLRRLTMRHLGHLEARRHLGWSGRFFVALGRALLLLVPIVGFAAAGYVALMFLDPNSFARIIADTLIKATIAVNVIGLISRSLLSPLAHELRPLPLSDQQAALLFVWVGRLAAIGVFGYFAIELMSAFGLQNSSSALLLRLVGLTITVMVMVMILQSREAVAEWIRKC